MELAFAPVAAVAVAAGLGVELHLFAPSRSPRRGEAIVWSAGWLVLSLAVAAGIALTGGPAGEWTTVYLIERSLSLDNVFLFSLLLAYFLVPTNLRGRVILIGIAGALLLRGLAIAAGLTLIESLEAVVYAFGVLLVYLAYRTFRGAADESDPSANPILRLLQRALPTTSAAAGCSCAKRAASMGRRSCSRSSRSSLRTSPSRSTRSPRRSRSPAIRS